MDNSTDPKIVDSTNQYQESIPARQNNLDPQSEETPQKPSRKLWWLIGLIVVVIGVGLISFWFLNNNQISDNFADGIIRTNSELPVAFSPVSLDDSCFSGYELQFAGRSGPSNLQGYFLVINVKSNVNNDAALFEFLAREECAKEKEQLDQEINSKLTTANISEQTAILFENSKGKKITFPD